jgi:hypothetical protein
LEGCSSYFIHLHSSSFNKPKDTRGIKAHSQYPTARYKKHQPAEAGITGRQIPTDWLTRSARLRSEGYSLSHIVPSLNVSESLTISESLNVLKIVSISLIVDASNQRMECSVRSVQDLGRKLLSARYILRYITFASAGRGFLCFLHYLYVIRYWTKSAFPLLIYCRSQKPKTNNKSKQKKGFIQAVKATILTSAIAIEDCK